LWDFFNFNCDVSDNSEISLRSHDNMIDIWAIRNSWPQIFLTVCALASDKGNVLNDIFNVSVVVFLHATCSGRNPPSKS
jgi:hypothetical protein